ncbi:hypothetical protein WAI453_003780 [Rhynchosporium graminicola]
MFAQVNPAASTKLEQKNGKLIADGLAEEQRDDVLEEDMRGVERSDSEKQ